MKNEYTINKKTMLSWARKLPENTAPANIILWILWGIVGVISLLLLAILIVTGGDWFDWYIAIVLLALTLYKLFFARLITAASKYRMCVKTYGVAEWQRAIEFTEDEIIVSDHTSVSRFGYDTVKKIQEKKNVVVIRLKSDMGIVLYKDTFVEGTWEECKAFLASKMTK